MFCVCLGLDSGFDSGPVIVLIAVGCVCLVDCVCCCSPTLNGVTYLLLFDGDDGVDCSGLCVFS